jgi:MFS family permease
MSAQAFPPTDSGGDVGRAEPPRRWSVLAILGLSVLLGMSLWFTASATATQLAALWNLEPAQAASLTTSVQIGFVAGTALAAILNLADIVAARWYFAISALLAAASNAALVIVGGVETALVTRFLTGFFLAGVYPPAMKMIATWFRSARGLAIGALVGALTVGKALPYLIGALATVDYRFVALTTSAGAVCAGILVAIAYTDGPFPFPKRPFSWSLVGVIVRDRPTRLAIGGYLGHMWELYAMWTLVSVFFYELLVARGMATAAAVSAAGLIAFAAIALGGPGSVVAGKWADRMGRERVAIWSMAVSGTCCLLVGLLSSAPTPVLIGVAFVWGFAIVADSAQFSALVTEVAPPHAVGTALTLQTSLGFLLTAFSIPATIALRGALGWSIAFALLAIGPAFGIWAILRLQADRTTRAN